ncbi:MAG: ABC transporter permease [Acidobacteriota bacterium]
MFKNNLTIALRHIGRHKGYSFVNIAGLAVGMASTILILLWVQDELSYDRFHEKADRIYRVVLNTSDDGAGSPTNANGPFGLGPALKRDFPEVVEAVRIRKMEQSAKRYVGCGNKKFYESRFFFAEPSIFAVFDFPLVRGDSATALDAPNSIVLTEDMAKKYFPNEDPMGRTIEADPYNDGQLMLFRVTGIAGNVPRQSHVHFDFLASYSSQRDDTNEFSGIYQHYTYVLLDSPSSAASLEPKLLDFLHRNWREDPWYTISLQPLLDIHLHSALRSEVEPTGSILYIYAFTAIALLVLVIACINSINLSTARASKRAREVGIRKAVGAPRSQLVRQFLGESLSFSVAAALAAALLVVLTLPFFDRLAGKDFDYSSLINPSFLIGTAAIALAVGITSGIYPAFVLSAFQPVQSLKSRVAPFVSGMALRKGLVVFQFAMSIGIICATLIVHKQMRYIQSRNLGYDKDQIMVIPLNPELRLKYEGLRNELLKNPGIENATTSQYVPAGGSAHLNMRFEGKGEEIGQVIYAVDREFVKTYGLTLLAGNGIERPISTDEPSEFLVSERTTREAGYSSPQEAIGKSAALDDYRGQIVGVVNDINIYSLRQEPYATCYAITSIRGHNYLSVRLRASNVPETISYIRQVWQRMIPSYPLDYSFLDASFEQLHRSDQKLSDVFSVFSILAILVACLGLFGLAAYTAEQKTKEIAVRKILGASVSGICLSLSQEFLQWVALANIIALPLAYFGMHRWLLDFAYKTSVGPGILVLSGLLALLIAWLTVGYQAIRAARANPVASLRYE